MKVFREEKRPATFILIDKRASMRFGSRKRLKISQAIRLSAYAAFSAIHRHCAVAGVVLNEQLDWFDACYDDGGVYHFLNKAAEACIPAYNMSSDGASLDSTIKLLQKMMVAGSDVCLVSDFHDLGEASRAALLQLSLECNVTAIQVYDPAEEELPSSGSLFMNENSNTEAAFVNTEDELVRQAFHEEMISRYEKVKQFFAGIGINHVRVSTDCEDIDRVMLDG